MLGLEMAHRTADRFAVHCERRWGWYVSAFSLVMLPVLMWSAARKLFWYDELSTLYLSRLPDFGMLWTALTEGVDLNPPVLHILTRASVALLGEGHVAVRLPEILAVWVACLCLFRFVQKRCGAAYGLVAMTFPLTTGAYEYAIEARPYGLLLGATAFTLVCWQSAMERGRRRWPWLIGLGLGLTAALLTQCYAVLVLPVFLAAELARLHRERRPDWPLWIALALPCISGLVYLPLFGAARGIVFDNGLFRPGITKIVSAYIYWLSAALWPLVLALIVLIVLAPKKTGDEPSPWMRQEAVAVLGLVAVPVMVVFLAIFVTRIYLPRYTVMCVIGLSILPAALAHWRAGNRRWLGLVIAALFLAAVPAQAVRQAMRDGWAIPQRRAEGPSTDLPVVAANGLDLLDWDYYGSPGFRARLHYLRDSNAAVRLTRSNVFEVTIPMMKKWMPIRAHIEDYASFTSRNRRFLLFGERGHPLVWLYARLKEDGAQLALRGTFTGQDLWEVTLPETR